MKTAYASQKIFTGNQWLFDHAVLVEDDKILDIVTQDSLPSDAVFEQLGDTVLAPAFIDLQIYGAGGRLLSVFPDPTSLKVLYESCSKGGTAWTMPTVATNTYDVVRQCIDAIRAYWAEGGKGILGLHIEGPWINARKRGAHLEELIHKPAREQALALFEYGKDVIRIVTLAPEVCDQEIIDLANEYGIIVSAGHSDADYETARHSFAKGITAVTHLYNAMSPLSHRAPGLVGAAMDDRLVMASIIPDGHHVDYAAIRIAKEVMKERLFVITDAVTTTDKGPYQHQPVGDKFESGGILSGSALSMNKAVANLVRFAGVEYGEALRMCSLYPARLMQRDDKYGMLAKGYDARIVVLDSNFEVSRLIG